MEFEFPPIGLIIAVLALTVIAAGVVFGLIVYLSAKMYQEWEESRDQRGAEPRPKAGDLCVVSGVYRCQCGRESLF